MTTTDLTPAAQLYIALYWDGVHVALAQDGKLRVLGPQLLLDLYRPYLVEHEPAMLTLLAQAEAFQRAVPVAYLAGLDILENAPGMDDWRLKYRVLAEALDLTQSIKQLWDMLRPFEASPVDGGLSFVAEAVALAALGVEPAFLPLPKQTADDYDHRRRMLEELSMTPVEHGLERAECLQFQFEHAPPHDPYEIPELTRVDRSAAVQVLVTRGMDWRDADLKVSEAEENAAKVVA